MFLPVERSITVSAPQRVAQRSFSTSSSMTLLTAELPMLALIFTAKPRPMIIGSTSGWLMLAGMMARPAGHLAPHELGRHPLAEGHELHFRGDVPPPRVVQLGDGATAAVHRALERGRDECVLDPGVRRGDDRLASEALDVTFEDPGQSGGRESLADIRPLRAAGVVDPERGLAAGEQDFPHGDADAAAPLEDALAGVGKGVGKEEAVIAALPSPVSAGSGSKGIVSIRRADVRGDAPGGVTEV